MTPTEKIKVEKEFEKNTTNKTNKQNKQTCVENHDKLIDKHRLNSRASLEKQVRQGSIWECGS